MPKRSPYRSAAYRKAARAAAINRIQAKEERTPEHIEEELSAARKLVKELERELEEVRKEGKPEEESNTARLSPQHIYGRMNGGRR